MKAALEPDVDIRFKTATLQRRARAESSFTRSLHQLPVRQWHCGDAGLNAPRHNVRIGPIRVNTGDTCDAGTHGHNFCCAIGSESDCFLRHYLFSLSDVLVRAG